MKTLIVTGLGWIDYAVAAGLALRHFKKADLKIASSSRLPVLLSELAASTSYSEIVILGVGLSADPALLERALVKLAAQKITVIWVSVLDAPDTLPKSITKNLVMEVNSWETLSEHVSDLYGQDFSSVSDILSKAKGARGKRDGYAEFIEAAMYVYRNYQDSRPYQEVIRHIERGDAESAWSEAEVRMRDTYRRHGHRELTGKSPAMKALRAKIAKVALSDRTRVLICGESGTGKETVALHIHYQSPRNREPFLAFNCASVAPELLESRFLGYEKGAFTGATETKRGIFEQADGGTLFLDEIGELPLSAQGVLLRVLEGGRFYRLGEKQEVSVDVRVIAATNRDLPSMVAQKGFREDLFFRLNVVQLVVPSLRERREDIREIATQFSFRYCGRRPTPAQLDALVLYDYPGNVRELINLIERAHVLGETDFTKLLAEHREMTVGLSALISDTNPDNLEEMIRLHVRRIYEKYGSSITHAATALGVSRNTVRKYLG